MGRPATTVGARVGGGKAHGWGDVGGQDLLRRGEVGARLAGGMGWGAWGRVGTGRALMDSIGTRVGMATRDGWMAEGLDGWIRLAGRSGVVEHDRDRDGMEEDCGKYEMRVGALDLGER